MSPKVFGVVDIEAGINIFKGSPRRILHLRFPPGWVIMNGNRIQIKRKQFEKIIDTLDVI